MKKEFEVSAFDRVEVGLTYEFEITRGENPEVWVDAEEGFFKNVRVEVTGGILKVDHSRHIAWTFRLSRPKLWIVMPEIKSLKVSGAATGKLTGFDSLADFFLELKGATGLEGEFKAVKTDIRTRGACHLKLAGESEMVVVDAGGTADLDMEKFAVGDAAVRLAGVSHGTINVTGRLDVRLSGVSDLKWVGEPTMGDIRTSGVSTLKKLS